LSPGLIVTASDSNQSRDWGFAAEWLINGTLRWSSEALTPTPVHIETSTEFVVIVASAPVTEAQPEREDGEGGGERGPEEESEGMTLFGIDRNTGMLLWTFRCQIRCRAQV